MSKVVRLFSLISLISQLLFSDFAFFPINFQIGGITHLISKTWDVWEQPQQKKKKKNASERKQKKANPFISNNELFNISLEGELENEDCVSMSEVSHTKKKTPKGTNPNLRWVRWSKRQMMVSVLNQTIKKGMH